MFAVDKKKIFFRHADYIYTFYWPKCCYLERIAMAAAACVVGG